MIISSATRLVRGDSFSNIMTDAKKKPVTHACELVVDIGTCFVPGGLLVKLGLAVPNIARGISKGNERYEESKPGSYQSVVKENKHLKQDVVRLTKENEDLEKSLSEVMGLMQWMLDHFDYVLELSDDVTEKISENLRKHGSEVIYHVKKTLIHSYKTDSCPDEEMRKLMAKMKQNDFWN